MRDTSRATVDHDVQPANEARCIPLRKAGTTHVRAVPLQLGKLFATCEEQHEL